MMNETLEQYVNDMADKYDRWDHAKASSVEFIIELCEEYAPHFNTTPVKIFLALEKQRTYSYPSYYARRNFPKLDEVHVFDTTSDMITALEPERGFICPDCNGVSSNPNKCDTGIKKEGQVCHWTSYGVFGTLNKGAHVVIRDEFLQEAKVYEIFMPVALREKITKEVA